MLRPLLLALALGAVVVPASAADTYTFDPNHSQVRFTYDHMGFSNILGLIGGIEGELVYDAEQPANSRVNATIPIAGIRTGVEKMDQHLNADDFFDTAQFPNATFASTKVEAAGEGRLKVTGSLTIRDVTREVVLEVSLNGRGEHPMRKTQAIGFDGRSALKRSDFGVGKYVPVVGDDVEVTITVEANVKAD